MSKKINDLFFLRPWAMKHDTLMVLTQIVERHLQGEKLSEKEIAARIGDKKEPPDYQVVNATAVIPIYGVISKRASMIGGISQPRGTSVEAIQNDFMAALEDPTVKSILLDVDSPGGSVSGILELSDFIFQARGKKPITAFANGQMDSAAYWLGSAADKIFASKSSEVGSIGVYTVINDYSVYYHNEGIKREVIKAGKFKAAGDPSKPLTEDEKNLIQEEIDTYYDLFVEAVARNRGLVMENVLKLADGRVFIGQKAVDAGLVDGIRTFESFLSTAQGKGPKAIAVSEGVSINAVKDINQNEEEHAMEMTVENLKAEHKPVADALLEEGKAIGLEEGKRLGLEEGKRIALQEAESAKTQAVNAEKVRCAGILESMPSVAARKIAMEAINNGSTVEAAKSKYLQAVSEGTLASIGDGGEASHQQKINQPDPQGKLHLARAEEYAKEHKCSITEALKHTAKPRE